MINENERINEINESLRLIEKKDSLTFGTDAYLLSAYLKARKGGVGVELGCGSGVVSLLALTKKKCQHVYGIEVQEEIAEVARRNSKLNSLDDKFTVISSDLREIKASDIGGEADIVFSNPPYMRADSGKLNANEQINDFCACAKRLLKHGGDFYVVYRPDRMADLIFALKSNNLEPKRLTFIHKDTDTPPSLLLISAKLGGKSGMTTSAPVYIYKKGTNEYTEEYSKIYESCTFGGENEK